MRERESERYEVDQRREKERGAGGEVQREKY